MRCTWKKWLDRVLREGEIFGLVFTTLMLIVVEGCFVYWLHRIQLPDRPFAPSGFLAMPPWYRKPRFEVTFLLTIAAGLLFSVCRGLWLMWKARHSTRSGEIIKSLRSRVNTAASIAVLAGFDLALATWLR